MQTGKRRYLMLMGLCLVLFVASWTVVPRWSPRAAVVTAVVAMAIPPVAVIVANADWLSGRGSRRPRASQPPTDPPTDDPTGGPADRSAHGRLCPLAAHRTDKMGRGRPRRR